MLFIYLIIIVLLKFKKMTWKIKTKIYMEIDIEIVQQNDCSTLNLMALNSSTK